MYRLSSLENAEKTYEMSESEYYFHQGLDREIPNGMDICDECGAVCKQSNALYSLCPDCRDVLND